MLELNNDFKFDRSNEELLSSLDQLLFIFKDEVRANIQELEYIIGRDHHRKGFTLINARTIIPILASDNYIKKDGNYWHITSTGITFEGYIKQQFREAINLHEEREKKKKEKENNNSMIEIRKDFEEIKKELYRALLIAENLIKLDDGWAYNKHNEDFDKIYDLPFHLKNPLEQVYGEGRSFCSGLILALQSFNDVSRHSSIVTWIENIEQNWINQKVTYEEIVELAKQTQINLGTSYNSINQMLDSFESQISTINDISILTESIKRSSLYKDELAIISGNSSDEKDKVKRRTKILFLGANPLDETRLRLNQEIREIEKSIKSSKLRDNLEIKSEWAVTPSSLQQALLDENPTIVQFSGHGSNDGIAIENDLGNSQLIDNDSLGNLFDLFSDEIQCVFLNSCFSEAQAEIISVHIPYVIGMSSEVPDDAAIAFSIGFYQAIGAGKNFEFAYKLGVSSIKLKGIEGSHIPILMKK
jgi:hypothetical protein